MCGIAGMMTTGAAPDAARLDRLAGALAHRGPDGEGRFLGDTVGLAQVRLSIIDLAGGGQPILDESGTVIVANGEIYNYRELRAAMPDQRFATGSDCEPPLHLYRRHGLDFVDHLSGMYALALFDPAAGRLILARDPFGIKPLYLAEGPWGLAFASEAQALIMAGFVAPAIDPQARAELLQMQFTCGADTIFPGITRLLPGEMVVAEKGRVVERRHRAALPDTGRRGEGAMERLDQHLRRAVEMHQRADVPYGMFLSGGIDSAVLLTLMADLNPRGVLAFTAGFPGSAAPDERDRARALARAVGAEHHEVEVTEDDFWDLLPAAAAAMDDPAADYAILPTFKLAAAARPAVKVILTGEGGDELFGGYGRYRGRMRPWPFTRAMRRTGTFDGLDVLRPGITDGWRDRFAATERAAARPGRSALQAAQAADCADWLPHDLLTKADRCLMAHGIEGRVPFLDPDLAAFAFSLPDRLKVRKGLGKWLLRDWLARAQPAATPFERKQGFSVPVGEWIARRPEIGALLARQPGIAEICRPGTVEALFNAARPETGFARWTLLFYALWHRRHVLGRRPDAGSVDLLADRL
jgi:asparagine synthase (glutamine-hydrolysing)